MERKIEDFLSKYEWMLLLFEDEEKTKNLKEKIRSLERVFEEIHYPHLNELKELLEPKNL